MFNTSQNNKMVEVLSGPERRRRRRRRSISQEKIAIIQQTMEPGITVSHVLACMASMLTRSSNGVGSMKTVP